MVSGTRAATTTRQRVRPEAVATVFSSETSGSEGCSTLIGQTICKAMTTLL
jgi:hypothetical protein